MQPLVDIHTHGPCTGGICIRSHRLGVGEAAPAPAYSEGIHPWDVEAIVEFDPLYQAIASDDIVAVGEIGLDKLRAGYRRQTEVFRRQLGIAQDRGLPVIVHCVKSFEQVMAILAGYKLKAVIFHGYIGSPQQTERLVAAGYYVSAGEVSFGSPKTVASLRSLPRDRLFLETDDGNGSISDIYSHCSLALDIPQERLREIIYNNYNKVFG